MKCRRDWMLMAGLMVTVLALSSAAVAQEEILAVVGGTVFDALGNVHEDGAVLVRGERIEAVGEAGEVTIPDDARRVDASGGFVLPGFVDLHFHYDPEESPWLPSLFLANGVTTQREMGNWIEHDVAWLERTREAGLPVPRLLYSGPLLDGTRPAYPEGSLTLLDELDARRVVRDLLEQGATSLKVYFRLPLSLGAVVIEEGHAAGVPVHAHTEIVDVRHLIRLGLDGIEHTTSVGQSLIDPFEAEQYRQAVYAESAARGPGRYEMWKAIDPEGERARDLIEMMVDHGVNLDATLAVFEPRRGHRAREDRWQAVRNMADFTVAYHRAGGSVTIGSHGVVPNAAEGFAFQREMEAHLEAGMSAEAVLIAATASGAETLGLEDRGTLEEGKLADLVVLDGDPRRDFSRISAIRTVILGGKVLDRDRLLATQPERTGLAVREP